MGLGSPNWLLSIRSVKANRLWVSSRGTDNSPSHNIARKIVDEVEQVIPSIANAHGRPVFPSNLVRPERFISGDFPGGFPKGRRTNPPKGLDDAVATRRADPKTFFVQRSLKNNKRRRIWKKDIY